MRRSLHQLSRFVTHVLVAVTLLYTTAGWLRCRLYANQVTALVGFGCRADASCWSERNRASLPSKAVVYSTGGYDGQFYFYLASELAGGPPAVLDSPPFRRARIGLSVLAAPWLAAGDAGRRYGLSLTIAFLHLTSVWLFSRSRPRRGWQLWVFALNPFSLLSFLLSTADGAALSLAVMGALALERARHVRVRAVAWLLLAGLLLAAAPLTKETAVIVTLALAGAALFEPGKRVQDRFSAVLLAGVTLVPLGLWWRHVGFSFGLAAAHGGLPFAGVVGYLPRADLIRGMLIVVLLLAIAAGASLLRRADSRAAGFALLGTVALISTATAHEYWATISNVARLFTPMAAAPVLLRDNRTEAPLASASTLRLTVAWAAATLLLTLIILLRDASRAPLPFFVLAP